MSGVPSELWPWLAIAGLGLFHGLNPAMGWLFAVALGLHRHSQKVVLLSLVPIAVGHALAVATVIAIAVTLGLFLDWRLVGRLAGLALIAWALWHALYGHRQKTRVGMQTGLAGLAVWSFLMASAHGAGLMLLPALVPLCAAASPAPDTSVMFGSDAIPLALVALGLHTAAMLAAIAIVSLVVYNWSGVAFLRSGWINLDLIWIAALLVCGTILLIT